MHIQPARLSDLPQILSIYENARSFMAQKGNPTQWINGYPDRAVLENDIARNRLFICKKKQPHRSRFHVLDRRRSYLFPYRGRRLEK